MSILVIYCTHKDAHEAKKTAGKLLAKKLIACANFFPVDSAYWWNGAIKNDHEIVSLFKTRPEHWDRVRVFIEDNHVYDVPCILRFEIEANKAYEEWVHKETQQK